MTHDRQLVAECHRLIGLIRRIPEEHHLECDDGFYSCPMSENHFSVDYAESVGERACRCGADSVNAHRASLNEAADQLERRLKR